MNKYERAYQKEHHYPTERHITDYHFGLTNPGKNSRLKPAMYPKHKTYFGDRRVNNHEKSYLVKEYARAKSKVDNAHRYAENFSPMGADGKATNLSVANVLMSRRRGAIQTSQKYDKYENLRGVPSALIEQIVKRGHSGDPHSLQGSSKFEVEDIIPHGVGIGGINQSYIEEALYAHHGKTNYSRADGFIHQNANKFTSNNHIPIDYRRGQAEAEIIRELKRSNATGRH